LQSLGSGHFYSPSSSPHFSQDSSSSSQSGFNTQGFPE
jgi:hypothetical protein